jgi:hypothetical protein
MESDWERFYPAILPDIPNFSNFTCLL